MVRHILPFPSLTFAIVYWLACLFWLASEVIFILPRRVESGAQRQDRGSRLVVISLVGAGVILSYWLAVLVPAAHIPLPGPLIGFLGVLIVLLGVTLRLYALRILGRYFTSSVAVRAGQTVIQNGPYRYVRHPSYSGILLTLLGIGLLLANWLSIAAILGCALAGFSYRVSVEERALRDALGQPYADYMRRTRRFIPYLL